jgi:hypothetical protein
MNQLRELARPLPPQFIGKSDKGMDAADHTVITQRLLQVVGPHSFELVEVLRSEAPGITTKSGKEYPGGLYVTGVVARLTVEVDGRTVSVEEAGGCEQAALKDGDGERLKHAMSDAYKRAAMRLGLALHIWAQDMYFLDRQLDKDAGVAPQEDAA